MPHAQGTSPGRAAATRTRANGNGRPIKAASRFNERLQHRLEIEGRAANDLEYVGGGGLLLE